MGLSNHTTKSSQYSQAKSERLEARISLAQKELFQHAAHLSGRTLTDFIISALQEVASHVIRDHEVTKLSLHDRRAFVQALLNAPKPNKNLLKAAKRYHKKVKT